VKKEAVVSGQPLSSSLSCIPRRKSMRVSATMALLALAAIGGPAFGADRIVQYEHFTSAT